MRTGTMLTRGLASLRPSLLRLLEKAERQERRLAFQKPKDVSPPEIIPLAPRLAGPRDEIAMTRAKALRIDAQDLTPARLAELYGDAVARGLVQGVPKPALTQAEKDADWKERRRRAEEGRLIDRLRQWQWKESEVKFRESLEEDDMPADEREDLTWN